MNRPRNEIPSVPASEPREDAALRTILEGTATETGERFFAALVKNVAAALNTHGAWVTEYLSAERKLRALSFWMGGDWIPEFDMEIDGTPCGDVIERAELIHFPDDVVAFYPSDGMLHDIGVKSYMGVPLFGADRCILGHLAVLDTKPMPSEPRMFAVFRIFAARAAAELQRIRAENALREREAKLDRILSAAMDAIIEVDAGLRITHANPAAERIFHSSAAEMIGRPFAGFLETADATRLKEMVEQIDQRPQGEQCLWVAGGLVARGADGRTFFAEATLSRMEAKGQPYHTIVLRNVNDRLEAERKIQSLTIETEYLRQEIREQQNFGEIIGQSAPMRRLMEDVAQVAETDAAVLILGETGTGKELIARAIHSAGRRKDKSLIRVNCAAIPALLMESEFFGHEKGAFTGATARRDGRFALADGGTIFLDEIGELSLDLQAKLLRVLQDGEFEPVGSSRTRKVDVRVIAATNRDLEKAVRSGAFREDLYYRLNVFPIQVPPLRERGDDVALLARAFADRFCLRMGRVLAPLTPRCIERLKAYPWPGNVRELQNIIERAVITARDGRLNLDRGLPPAEPALPAAEMRGEDQTGRIFTSDELRALERANILRALESVSWKISGEDGAARVLGMNPSTLTSRIKALGISRPR